MDDRLRSTMGIVMAALLAGTALGAGGVGLFQATTTPTEGPGGSPEQWSNEPGELRTFESDAAFEAYFDAVGRSGGIVVARTQLAGGVDTAVVEEEAAERSTVSGDGADEVAEAPARHSGTNVQEAALDEPDVLKTDGASVYYAGYHVQRTGHQTSILALDDPAEPTLASVIPAAGELLLVEETDTLVVLDDARIWGYDVSDPSDPEQAWSQRIDGDLQTARLLDGTLYLVLVDRPDGGDPCPIRPYGDVPIACTEVYRPDAQADADAVYTAVRVDPATGELTDRTSVVGSVHGSATYVSEDAIYLSYTRSMSQYDFMVGYLTGPGAEHLDAATVERIEDLDSLDISERAKAVELQEILRTWFERLDDDERRATQRALDEGRRTYAADHQRELTRTGIARIAIGGDLDVTATGEVPGYPLNQWSMDEHEDHLRIATTVPGRHGADSVNDVYVLDAALDVTGSVEGLGETERIYAVRFQGDEGYVVTFREIDPFYTLDLADPRNPALEGELKIPGFSSYLHPLDDDGDLVLGVGQEDRQLKLSLFDVSDRAAPDEVDVVVFDDEHFSEAIRNHRAFLHDERHDVFFLPAGEASYVFAYEDGRLEEVARVEAGGPGVRAMYVDDYLYVFGPEAVVVLDQTTWAVETRVDVR